MAIDENTRHLLFRGGFGPGLNDIRQRQTLSTFMKTSSRESPIHIVEKIHLDETKKGQSRQELFKHAKEKVIYLNAQWIQQMASPEMRFREKMTFFWHDHFACRMRAPYLVQQHNNVIRENSLGSFRKLLAAVSKDPAMLQFLNNQQNKKHSPNENFAREVLELFTLGRGHYTESDVKNAARSFTGWGFNSISGHFSFRRQFHDEGIKVFKGRTGNFSGEDVLDIILEDRLTAQFITEKIWSYFVSPTTPPTDIISWLANRFYESNYSITALMRDVFSADWFYEKRYIGTKIKSPIELLTGILIQTGGHFSDPQSSLFIQRALGQVLFFPPNVGGWPSGISWIDSSSLTFRLSLPAILFKDTETNIEAKDDGDVNNVTNAANTKKLAFHADWLSLTNEFTKSNTDLTLEEIERYLLAIPASNANKKIVRDYSGKASHDADYMMRAFTAFMSLPEYQLN